MDGALIKQQLGKLDTDLALHVILSGLSLNSEKVLKTLGLMSALMMARIEEREPPVSELAQKEYAVAQELMIDSYLDSAEKAQ